MTPKAPKFEEVTIPSGGWGSLKAVAGVVWAQRMPLTDVALLRQQNKTGGYACVSCAWAKPAHPHPAEFCENGAKATAWELTSRKVDATFFAEHTIASLRGWSDYALEDIGRLTVPLKWDSASDRYLPVDWAEAFADIGARLKQLEPKSVVFYSSGRASLEASYMYQLLARAYGCNNLPDSSNMCHESTSVALPKTIGVPVGTATLEDFDHCDAIFFFGQNVGVNSPRMLHQLQEARKRGAEIITFNPLRERGLVSFTNPQSPVELLSGSETVISTQYHQVKVGGDTAAILGMTKALLAIDDAAIASGAERVLDTAFIEEHTHGLADYEAAARRCSWDEIERMSGLTRAALEDAAGVYARAKAVIAVYGMGITQHREGVRNVQMVSNLLLLRGNIGKLGAGICPVRGHSNVQGQRTVGITEKPELAPLDKLKELYGFEPPRDKGLNTVEACRGVLDGSVRAFIGLGGNFVRAVPDTKAVEAAWPRLALTVQIATKLNRSHLIHGEVAYLLPCLGRIEIDRQSSGEQAVSVEDSTGFMHGSRGPAEPAGPLLLSELAIIGAIAEATLPDNAAMPWSRWVADYSLVRDAIAATYPQIFADFNDRMWQPGGFPRPIPARQRIWKTPNGKANFIAPDTLDEDSDTPATGADVLRLTTVRSDDQFNTTVYSLDDRFRGVYGTRDVLLANGADMERLGLQDGDVVTAVTVFDDGLHREVPGLRVTRYDIPPGCVAGYFPECNPLIPLAHHARDSQVPAAKSVPVRLTRTTAASAAAATA